MNSGILLELGKLAYLLFQYKKKMEINAFDCRINEIFLIIVMHDVVQLKNVTLLCANHNTGKLLY